MKKILNSLFVLTLFISCNQEEKKEVSKIENPTNKVILSSDIIWEKLNPARGDKSPQAGTIWGDRKGKVATGFLAKFVDGFSSPPHIHNVTYRAVVIEGLIHNDDPAAANMWMPKGSFWTQPKGESHITSAKGDVNIAYVEIDHGPYLVKPIDQAFDNGEKPVNISANNVVWLNNTKTNCIDSNSNAEISFLWEGKNTNKTKGLFIKLPKQFSGKIKTDSTILHAVIISGNLTYEMPKNEGKKTLDPGSYFTSTAKAEHSVTNHNEEDVIIYIRTNGNIYVE